MILERVEDRGVVFQGLSGCRTPQSATLLRELRLGFPRCEVQLFRADRIAGKEHLLFAASEAIRAFRQHRERARTLAVELLLYVSCQRQISKAIQLLGVGPRTNNVVLAAITNDKTNPQDLGRRAASVLNAKADDTVVEIISTGKQRELMRAYKVSDTEIEAARQFDEEDGSVIKRLIIERSALLAVEK